MNKQNVKHIFVAAVAASVLFGVMPKNEQVTAQAAASETNGCYTMVATGTDTADGVTVMYFNNSSDFTFEFDLIKAPKHGEMGFINAKKSSLDLTAADFNGADAFFFGTDSADSNTETTFVAGYRYRMEMNRAEGVLRLSKKSYRNESSAYTSMGNFTMQATGTTMFGLAVRSDGAQSAWALIDNCKVSTSAGSSYETFESAPKGMYPLSSNENGYAELHKGPQYTVVFMDTQGRTIKTVLAREYTALSCKAPAVEGMVHVGWSEDIWCVTKDMIVTPVYETMPEKEDSSTADSSVTDSSNTQSGTENGGMDCNSTLSIYGALSVLPILVCGAWILKKGDKEE